MDRDVQQKPDQQVRGKSRSGSRDAGGVPPLADLQQAAGNQAVSRLVATMLQRDPEDTPTSTPPTGGTTSSGEGGTATPTPPTGGATSSGEGGTATPTPPTGGTTSSGEGGTATPTTAPPTGGATTGGTPSATPPPTTTHPPDLQQALTDKTPGAINAVRDFSSANEAERISLIEAMCGAQLDTTGAATVLKIWQSFGTQLPHVASNHDALWDKCKQRGAHLPDSLLGTGVGHRDIKYNETVGSWVYQVHGVYDYRVVHDAIQIKVPINFVPDSGVSAPVDTWFGYIKSTWNHYSAVNRDNPTEKKAIDFQPVQSGTGQKVQVTAGDGRANAGKWYAADSRATNTIPHEFGHLIGLEDEYELKHTDYVRVTGEQPQAGSGDTTKGLAVARAVHHALMQEEHFFEWHTTAVGRRMDALKKVLDDNSIPRNYSTPLSRQVAKQYKDQFGNEIPDDIVKQIDKDPGHRGNFQDWREGVSGVFSYTNTSLMGNPDYNPDPSRATTGHEQHAVQPRHVRQFSDLVQGFAGHGHFEPREDH